MSSYQAPLPADPTPIGQDSFRGDVSEPVESSSPSSSPSSGAAAAATEGSREGADGDDPDPSERGGSEPGMAWLEAPRADEGDACTVRVLLVDERMLACRHRSPRPAPSATGETAADGDGGRDGAERSPEAGGSGSAVEESGGGVRHPTSSATAAAAAEAAEAAEVVVAPSDCCSSVSPLLVGLASLSERSRSDSFVSCSSFVAGDPSVPALAGDAQANASTETAGREAEGEPSPDVNGSSVDPSAGGAGGSDGSGTSQNDSSGGGTARSRDWFSGGVLRREGGDDKAGDGEAVEDANSGSGSGSDLRSDSSGGGRAEDEDAGQAQTREVAAVASTDGPPAVDHSGPPPPPPPPTAAKEEAPTPVTKEAAGDGKDASASSRDGEAAEVNGGGPLPPGDSNGSVERAGGEAMGPSEERETHRVSVVEGGAGAGAGAASEVSYELFSCFV